MRAAQFILANYFGYGWGLRTCRRGTQIGSFLLACGVQGCIRCAAAVYGGLSRAVITYHGTCLVPLPVLYLFVFLGRRGVM